MIQRFVGSPSDFRHRVRQAALYLLLLRVKWILPTILPLKASGVYTLIFFKLKSKQKTDRQVLKDKYRRN